MTFADFMQWLDLGAAFFGFAVIMLALWRKSWSYEKRTFYLAWGILVAVSLK